MKARLLALGGMILATGLAVACCVVTINAKRVAMMDQTNIIVWEPDTKTEHFIRNAKFATDAPNPGFIAPTPSVPKMEEVDPEAFKTITAAIEEFNRELNLRTPSKAAGATEAAADASSVEVVQVANVAGFKAVTVKASDASGLARWMKSNGFVTTPSIQTWTDFYIKKGWYLTTFKVSTQDGRAQTGLVKLSFKTDEPFNPYYVPGDNIPKEHQGRGLLVYFIAPGTYQPTEKTKGQLHYDSAAPIEGGYAEEVKKHLKLTSLPTDTTVTAFVDYGFPHKDAKDDVYFERSGPQPQLPPLPIQKSPVFIIAVGVAIVAALAYGWFSGKLRRRWENWVNTD